MTSPVPVTAYRCRAQSRLHAIVLHATLHPWVQEFNIRGGSLPTLERDRLLFSEADVEFTLKNDGPTLEEILWLIDTTDDRDLIPATLTHADEYNGKRRFRGFREAPARQPRREIMATMESVVYRNISRWTNELIQRDIEKLPQGGVPRPVSTL